MPCRKILLLPALLIVGSAVLTLVLAAQDFGTGPVIVKVLVTVTSKGQTPPPEVAKDAVSIRLDDQALPVQDWQPASKDSAPLALIIDVDDDLDPAFGSPLKDLGPFIRALPRDALVEVAYSGVVLQRFTTVHEAAAAVIRTPGGHTDSQFGVTCDDRLIDLEKHWPAEADRREVLFIGEGNSCEIGSDYEDLIDRSHREGVPVFTIYADGPASGLLQTVSDETGGEAFIGLPSLAPFKPYLDQLSMDLANQYFLTFEAVGGYKMFISKLQVRSQIPGIEIHAPTQVDVPASPAGP
jgi:hypothetical protein